MTPSRKGLALIKRSEGRRLTAYVCPAGHWTIGYGHTSMAGPPNVTPGMKITAAEADKILLADLAKFSAGMMKKIKVGLTQGQYDALLSLAYNIGLGNFGNSTLLEKLNDGDVRGAAEEFPKWRKGGGKVLPGLVKRRAEEKALFLSGDVVEPYIETSPEREVEIDTGKPASQSTTVWTAIGAAITSIFTAIAGLGEKQPLLAGFIVVVAMLFALYIIRERRRLGREGMI